MATSTLTRRPNVFVCCLETGNIYFALQKRALSSALSCTEQDQPARYFCNTQSSARTKASGWLLAGTGSATSGR
jgi:hypothetical protein